MRPKYLLFAALVTAILLTASITHAARVLTKDPYVVAARTIPCGSRLTAADVTLYTPYKRYDYIPFTGFEDVQRVIGKYVDLNLVKGNTILSSYLRDTTDALQRCKPKSR